ncbi:MAG: hypothetical protein ACLQDY_04035 [Streptosporangiaceae bacterium]
MPGLDDLNSPAGHAAADREGPRHPSRRSVLAGAGAGLAATAFAGMAAPALASTPPAPAAQGKHADGDDAAGTEQVVVHVRDARTGEIDVFRGTSHTRLQDRELAARLVRASR